MRIHIHSRQGLYTVVSYNNKVINLMTKHYEFSVPTTDFKSFAGGMWDTVNPEDKDKFLKTIHSKPGLFQRLFGRAKSEDKPEMYKKKYHSQEEEDDLPF
jgi:hypothetical protein